MPPAAQNDHRKHSAVTDFCTNGDSEDNPKKSRGGVLGPRRDSARSIAGRHLQAKAPSPQGVSSTPPKSGGESKY